MAERRHEPEDDRDSRRPTDVDELACDAKRHRTYADSLGGHLDGLLARRNGLGPARRAYCTARATARPEVAELRTALHELLDRIRGMLEPDQVERLDVASQRLHKELTKHCPLPGHRQVEGFGLHDHDVPHKSTDDLRAQRLLLPERVSRLRAEIKHLDEDSCADRRTIEPRVLYARGLAIGQHLHDVCAGFDDVDDFGEWLWSRFSVSARGHQVLALIEANLAFRECEAQHRSQHCDWQREHFAEAVLLHGHAHEHEHHDHEDHQHHGCGDHNERRERQPHGYDEEA